MHARLTKTVSRSAVRQMAVTDPAGAVDYIYGLEAEVERLREERDCVAKALDEAVVRAQRNEVRAIELREAAELALGLIETASSRARILRARDTLRAALNVEDR